MVMSSENVGSVVIPSPGFVLKGLSEGDKKVFVNVCYSNMVWSPHEDSAGRIRIPLSLGPMESDRDKKGNDCTVIDIIVSEETAKRSSAEIDLKREFTNLVVTAIELKYGIKITQIRPLKLGYKGSVIRSQKIRLEKQDIVQEEHDLVVTDLPDINFSFVLRNKAEGTVNDVLKLPHFRSTEDIIRENLANRRESTRMVDLDSFTCAEITLFDIINPYSIKLMVSRERVVCTARSLRISGELNVCHT